MDIDREMHLKQIVTLTNIVAIRGQWLEAYIGLHYSERYALGSIQTWATELIDAVNQALGTHRSQVGQSTPSAANIVKPDKVVDKG